MLFAACSSSSKSSSNSSTTVASGGSSDTCKAVNDFKASLNSLKSQVSLTGGKAGAESAIESAQQDLDKLKSDVPVIINFQSADPELAKRLVDFASGLTYALDGSMQRVADRVFLLTPSSISVSAEDKALLMERGFFNQY